MKYFNFIIAVLLLQLFSSCGDNEISKENNDTSFIMEVSWKGNVYHVKSTYDKDGSLVYLDDSFLSIYKNEILTNDSLVTYDAGEKSLAYYTSVDEMMKNLGLRFLDDEPVVISPSEARINTRTVASDTSAGRAIMYQHRDYYGEILDIGIQYTKFKTISRMGAEIPDVDWNDKVSSIKVYSNIPLNDSVYVNRSDVITPSPSFPNDQPATMGSHKYATNDLRVVFLGFQNKNYGGDVMCIVPDNSNNKCHYRLEDISWNDKMSSCTLRLAVKDLYSDSPSNSYFTLSN